MATQSFLSKTFNFMNGWILSTNRLHLIAVQHPVRTLKLETKEKLNMLKVPEKPKKPLGPYLQFISENRHILLKENPNIKPVEVIKRLSLDWKTISDERKLKYKEAFQKSMEVYDQEILKYHMNLTEEQKEILHTAATEKKNDRKKRKLTKLLKETQKPKRPRGPYLLYLQEQSKIRNVPQNILMKTIKDDWAMVSESERQRYKNEYLKAVATFEIELKNWEKKMLAEGHPELVRTKSKEVEHKPSRILDHKSKKSTKH